MGTGYKAHCHYLPDVNFFTSGPAVTARRPGRTVPYVAAPPSGADPGAGPAVTAGVASLAVRDLLRGIRRHGKILAALPHAIYLEFADTVPEPRVITVSPPDAIRLPNAIITGPWDAPPRVPAAGSGDCWAGGSRVLACGLDVRIVRWWDPSPVFGPLSRARLDHGSGVLARLYAAAEHAPGLAGHDGPGQLAACCASGDLAGAAEAAEHLVGLGPGLVPSGDSVVSGVLLALRLLGGAISGGTRAVWLANWLSAAVTCDATRRTTTLAASLRPRARPGPRCPRSCSGWQARSRLSRPRPGCSRCPRVPTSPGVWWQAAARRCFCP